MDNTHSLLIKEGVVLENKIYLLIKQSRESNKSLLELLEMFEPLLKKYSFMLEYEDAYHDLQLSLIEVIKKLSVKNLAHTEDKYYLSYIKKSINSKYLKLSKKIQDIKNYTLKITDDTNVEEYIDAANPVIDNYTLLFFNDMKEILTENEYDIIKMFYYEKRPISEIAEIKQVSRQYINQCKLKALKKLKSNYL